jgi:hypothetical protein
LIEVLLALLVISDLRPPHSLSNPRSLQIYGINLYPSIILFFL